ncbi:MAG: hypothetical protein ACI9G9_001334 [Psychromonas sp.]|jgi:hypothetical protein
MSVGKEVNINEALQLLQARKEALDLANRTPMRAHGKVLGKDLFTWFDCSIDNLCNTLGSFPYPVFWVARSEELTGIIQEESNLLEKIETIWVYNKTDQPVPKSWGAYIDKIRCFDSMHEALIDCKRKEEQKSILLLTGKVTDWQSSRIAIEEFIETHKRK